jgi:hypothetical protein
VSIEGSVGPEVEVEVGSLASLLVETFGSSLLLALSSGMLVDVMGLSAGPCTCACVCVCVPCAWV